MVIIELKKEALIQEQKQEIKYLNQLQKSTLTKTKEFVLFLNTYLIK